MLVCLSKLVRYAGSSLILSGVKLILAAQMDPHHDVCFRSMCSTSDGVDMPNDTANAVFSWSRIRLEDSADCDKAHQLLVLGYTAPQALHTVKEAVVKLKGNQLGCSWPGSEEHSRPYKQREQERKVGPDHPIQKLLRILDLQSDDSRDSNSTEGLIKSLTWYDPQVHIERESHLAEDPERRHVQSLIEHHDRELVHHAAPLALMLCPNIETLTYSACPAAYSADQPNGHHDHILCSTLLRNNYGKPPQMHLQTLRHVRVLPEAGLWWDDEETYSHIDLLGEIRLFHRLPAIESITVSGITRHGGADSLEQFPPHTSNIKRIYVTQSERSSSELAPLIRMPKRLEEFAFTLGGHRTRDGGYSIFCARTLGKALHDQRSSLRKLDVDVDDMLSDDHHDEEDYEDYLSQIEEYEQDDSPPYWIDEWWKEDEKDSVGPLHVYVIPDDRVYDNTIGSLHDFEQLTHLSLGIQLLLGGADKVTPFCLVEALPKSLEYFLIRGYTKGEVAKYDHAIDDLLARRSELLPALREIHGVEECIPSATVQAEFPDEEEVHDSEAQDRVWRHAEELKRLSEDWRDA